MDVVLHLKFVVFALAMFFCLGLTVYLAVVKALQTVIRRMVIVKGDPRE